MFDVTEMEPKFGEAAHLMQMLGNPIRLKILCILVNGEQSVSSLTEKTKLSQPATSHHLKQLREAGLVQTRRNAQTINYALSGTEVIAILEILHGLYCAEI